MLKGFLVSKFYPARSHNVILTSYPNIITLNLITIEYPLYVSHKSKYLTMYNPTPPTLPFSVPLRTLSSTIKIVNFWQKAEMYSTQFLPLIVHHLKLCGIINCLPFEFDVNSKQLILTKSFRKIRIFQFQCILTVIYCIVLLFHLCFSGTLTTLQKFQGLPFFLIYILLLCCRWNVSLNISPIQAVNSFLKFERELLPGTKLLS